MKIRLFHIPCVVAMSALSIKAQAQLSGTINVPGGTYPTLASVLTDLNATGVGATGVIINLNAAETAPAGGYNIGSSVLVTSATQRVVINGNGNIITAFAGSGARDAFFTLNGASYITIDNLKLAEASSNTTTATQMEYGFALYKAGSTLPYKGSQSNIISNCTITLNASNTSTVGIYGNATTSNGTALPLAGTTALDANSNNNFYGNTITGYGGIAMTGFNNTAAYDANNSYGVPTGNNINFGGGSALAYGINTSNDNIRTISNNTLVTLPNSTGQVIAVNTGNGIGTTQIRNNVFRLAAAGSIYACNNGGVNEPTGSYNVVGNVFGLSTSAIAMGIVCSSKTFDSLNITSNRIDSIISTGTSAVNAIQISSYLTHKTDISNNVVRRILKTGQGIGTITALNLSFGSPFTAGYYNNANNNVVDSIIASGGTANSAPALTGISIAVSSTQPAVCNNNKISNMVTTGDNDAYGIYATATGSATLPLVQLVGDSTINISATTGAATGIGTNLTPSGGTVQNCKVYGISSGSGTVMGLKILGGSVGSEMIVAGNNISHLSLSGATGSMYGMSIGGVAGAASITYNNMVSDFSAPVYSSDVVSGIYYGGVVGNQHKLFNNTVYVAFSSSSTKLGAQGVNFSPVPQLNGSIAALDMRNNIINVNVVPTGTGVTAAFYKTYGTAGTVPANLLNTSDANIFYVPNTPGSYLYTEIVGPNGGLVNSYTPSNDPGFSKSCGRLKSFLGFGFRNATENNLVQGTLPATYVPANSSFAKSLAVATTPAVTTDYAGAARPASADAGALQFTATALDNQPPVITFVPLPATSCFASPTLSAVITDASGVNTTAGSAPRLYYKKATEADTFGTYPANNNSSFNGWKYVEGVGTAPNFNFSIDYSKLAAAPGSGDSISYFVVAQDNSSLVNVSENVAALAVGYCASGVNLTSDAGPTRNAAHLNGYRAYPVMATVTAGGPLGLCAGDSVKLQVAPLPGATYQWTLNGSNITGATDTAYTASAEGAYAVAVTQNACVGTSVTENVIVHAFPDATISYTGDTAFCHGDTLHLNVAAGNNCTYQWFNNNTLDNQATGATYAAGGTGAYQVVVTNEFGCADSSQVVETVVNPLPVPVISRNGFVLTTGSFAAYQWNMDAQAIAQATNISYTCTSNGSYTVTVTDSKGCKGTSAAVEIGDYLGIHDVNASGIEVSLYPNPMGSMLYVKASVPLNVEIMSMEGKRLLYRTAASEIFTGDLPDGVYLILLTDKNGSLVRTDRLVKVSK